MQMRRSMYVPMGICTTVLLGVLARFFVRSRRLRREQALADLFDWVRGENRSVLLIVSNAKSTEFSARNLAKYLSKKGLSPSDDVFQNAQALVSLLKGRPSRTALQTGRKLKHELIRACIDPARLTALFPEMKESYVQQPLDYGRNSRYGDKWRISCYLVVMENWKPKIEAHAPMLRCLGGVMDDLVASFEDWYRDGLDRFSVMNAFVTRYRPTVDEDQLKKHIDGANVDGSVILSLPTDEPFKGGALHVWDGPRLPKRKEFIYTMSPGDVIFLDTRVWHQAKPITEGVRWALVLFLKLVPKKVTTKNTSS